MDCGRIDMANEKKSKNRYEGLSYWALDVEEREKVRQYVQGGKDKVSLDVDIIFKHANILTESISFYDRWINVEAQSQVMLAKSNKLTEDQKEVLLGELYLAYYRYSSQYRRFEIEKNEQKCKETHKKIRATADLINQLHQTSSVKTPEKQLQVEIEQSSRLTHYCGLDIVSPFQEQVEAATGNAEAFKKTLSEGNNFRLYWVWSSAMIRSILLLLPDYIHRRTEAYEAVNSLFPLTGSLSYTLYAIRGTLLWCGFLRHGLKGPWMEKEEYNIALTTEERWQLYWQPAKYTILNDTLWGPTNLACFILYLRGGALPFWADLLTAGILILDASLVLWRWKEEAAANTAALKRFEEELAVLDDKIREDPRNQTIYELAKLSLIKARTQYELDWRYNRLQVIQDVVYAVALFAGFLVLCGVFLPAGPGALLLLAAVGSVLCFALSLAYSMATSMTTIWKDEALIRSTGELLKEYPDDPLLFKEIEYQKKMKTYHCYQMIRSTVTDLLIPPLVICSLIFLPMGIGLPVLACGLALLGTVYLISKTYEPSLDESVKNLSDADLESKLKPSS